LRENSKAELQEEKREKITRKKKMSETENRGGEAAHNDNNNDDYNPGNFPRAIVPIQDVSEILSKYDFKEKIGTGGASLVVQF
jgi:hypothetical protein